MKGLVAAVCDRRILGAKRVFPRGTSDGRRPPLQVRGIGMIFHFLNASIMSATHGIREMANPATKIAAITANNPNQTEIGT